MTAVSQEVETSIVEICSRFQGMAKRANDARLAIRGQTKPTVAAQELTGGHGGQSAHGHAHTPGGCQPFRSTQCGQTMSTLRNGLNEVFDALSRIEKISSKVRIVVLNGQMEAVRAGNPRVQHSLKWPIRRVNLRPASKPQATAFAAAWMNWGRSIVSTRNELEQRVEDETHSLVETREAVLQTLCQLELTQERMEQGMAFAEQSAMVLSQEIGQAVVALQFQDAVCQRLAHVVYGLNEVRDAVEKHVDAKPSARWTQRRTQELFEKLSAQYTIARNAVFMGRLGMSRTRRQPAVLNCSNTHVCIDWRVCTNRNGGLARHPHSKCSP